MPIRRLALLLLLAPASYAATFTVSSSADSGAGTLRQAILDANANPGPDQIAFTVSSVNVGTPLPDIVDRVAIDGSVAGGRVSLAGAAATFPTCNLRFTFRAGSSGSTLHRVALPMSACGEGVVVDTLVTGVTVTDSIVRTVLVLGSDNVIGGTAAGTGNGVETIEVHGASNEVLRNTVAHVALEDSTGTRIGSPGNGNDIEFLTVFNSTGAIIAGNTFALVDFAPPAAAILVIPPNPASGTVIAGNVISGYERGIAIFSDGPNSGFTITGNSIFDIAQLPIDLGIDGPTPNDAPPDADPGANNLQNFPVLTSPRLFPTHLTVSGTLSSVPLTTYRIEVFGNPAADPEARTFLGSFDVTTGATGNVVFTGSVTTLPAEGDAVTATATNLTTNDTSEVSAPAIVIAAAGVAIPTLSTWSLIVLALGLATVMLLRTR